MTTDQQRPWDVWADGRILKMFAPGGHLHDVAEVISLLRCELRKEFTEQIGQQRADLKILRSIVAGKTVEIGRKDAA